MLTQTQLDQLDTLVETLTPEQIYWVKGFLAGLVHPQKHQESQSQSQSQSQNQSQRLISPPEQPEVSIVFGSQTGNAKAIATQLSTQGSGLGLQTKTINAAQLKPNDLKKITHLILVVSTYGDGEPPDNIATLHRFLFSKKAPRLEQLHYGVLALGDSSYPLFCQTGKDFDERLEALGAKRLALRLDCDVDYEADAAIWSENILDSLQSSWGKSAVVTQNALNNTPQSPSTSAYSKKKPFKAEIFHRVNLNDKRSDKQTYHLELSLAESGLQYEVGDALGIYPENDPELVYRIMHELGANPSDVVKFREEEGRLEDILTSQTHLNRLSPKVVKAFGEQIGQDISVAAEFLHGRDILDLIQEFRPEGLASNTFINLLEPIKPRLYSIASSLKAYEDEVHITVTRTGFESLGRWRKGVCSNFVADASEDSNLRVYIHENEQFRLPKDPSQAIVMVGAGTGIAPFRAFLQEREAIGATGKNWLFFGERRFRYDFLYQTEWQALQKSGVLTHIDLAFSRDQARKIYVQHKMLEKGKALFDWLENGASIYVCGDANFMAKDVEKALKTIIETQGREPETYLDALKTEGRYQRDVY